MTLLIFALFAAVHAQLPACPPVRQGEELRTLPEIRADRSTRRLETELRVQLREACIGEPRPVKLRTYGFPDPDRPGEWIWGFPGPVLRLRKADREGGQGDALWLRLRNELPADLHGDNNTNLHFHGAHVSPQYPQDSVLLDLRPRGAEVFAGHHHGPRAQVVHGEVQYKLDPLLWTQPEGTHWYHPHKHGSVSLQVTNGMAGPLLIEGPFDDWLNAHYGGRLREKVLVFQQVAEADVYAQDAFSGNPPLINGQLNPRITMRPGEVQRWRFINATVSSKSQIDIRFPAGAMVKQIAMDGIRFAPENYLRQPLLERLSLAPGNRADFLVQAPAEPGEHQVAHFTLKVAGDKVAQGFPPPEQWPAMPSYLGDVQEVRGTVSLTFDMIAEKPTINGKQFDGSCVDVTTRLGTALEWNVRNTSTLLHPFHVHVNPFQVVRNGGRTFTPPFVWQDTIALPPVEGHDPGSVLLRQRYADFTGEYVLHCHFLGHEDRGMMLAVQTVCPDAQDSFGKPRPAGQPECVAGNLIKAAPRCLADPVLLRN